MEDRERGQGGPETIFHDTEPLGLTFKQNTMINKDRGKQQQK